MGLIGAIFNGKVQFIQNNNSVVQFDASMKENHKRNSPATRFPVEDGTNISDHILIDPFSLDLVAIVSDSPIGNASQLLTEAATTVASKLIPPVGIAALGSGVALFSALSGAKKRSALIYEQLLTLQANKKQFDVVTSLKRYPGMFITGLSAPRTLEDGQAIAFSISIEQIIIVSPQSVNISLFANPGLSASLSNEGEKSAGIPNGFEQGYKDVTSSYNSFTGKGS